MLQQLQPLTPLKREREAASGEGSWSRIRWSRLILSGQALGLQGLSMSMARAREDDVLGGAVARHEVIDGADGAIARTRVVGWQIKARCRVLVQGRGATDSLEIFRDSKGG
jgi:hypothetical protein